MDYIHEIIKRYLKKQVSTKSGNKNPTMAL